jgi:hypothetical protein
MSITAMGVGTMVTKIVTMVPWVNTGQSVGSAELVFAVPSGIIGIGQTGKSPGLK